MKDGSGYDSGINSLEGSDFIDSFLSDDNQKVVESHNVVLVLMKSEEIRVIVDEMIRKEALSLDPTLVVEDRSTYWWIKGNRELEIDLDTASEILGRDYNVYDFLVNVSSTIGRAFTEDNKFIITTELVGIERPLRDIE